MQRRKMVGNKRKVNSCRTEVKRGSREGPRQEESVGRKCQWGRGSATLEECHPGYWSGRQ